MYPTKEQLQSKWWHRLAKVFIGFIVLVLFVVSIVVIINAPKKTKFILNTEQGYSERIEEEKNIKVAMWVSIYEIVIRAEETDSTIKEQLEEFWKNENLERDRDSVYTRFMLEGFVGNNLTDLRIKEWQELNYLFLWWLLLAPITCLVLWVLYYKIILYIVYGKKGQTPEKKT